MDSKIQELLKNDKTVIAFDVDGVLAPMEFGEYNHYYADDDVWAEEVANGTDFYKDVRVVKVFKDYINSKDKKRIYVITKVMNESEFNQKLDFLEDGYGILRDNCFMVYKDFDKLSKLEEIKGLYPELEDKDIAIVDDTTDILTYIMQNSKFSTIHISSFLK